MEQTADAVKFLEQLKNEKRILDFAVNKNDCTERKACVHPFTRIEIHSSGDCYTCCPQFINNYKIGNIWEDGFKEVWYGKKAQKLREKILKGDYSLCDLDLCIKRAETASSMLPDKCPAPKFITLAYDRECNLNCIICRDEKYRNSKEKTEFYNKKIDDMLPLFKEAETILISETGEALFSPHSRELIKRVNEINKTVKWHINSNGLLFNKKNYASLGLEGRINEVFISVHAIDREIYHKIMPDNDYDIVMKNIKEAAAEIKKVHINCVITNLNYKELPKLAEFAKGLNVYLTVSQFCQREAASFGRDYKSVSVWDKSHPEFEEFKKVLKHPALNYDKIEMTPKFKEIREEL